MRSTRGRDKKKKCVYSDIHINIYIYIYIYITKLVFLVNIHICISNIIF